MSLFQQAMLNLEAQVRSDTFPKLVKELHLAKEEGDDILVEASNQFFRRWFADHFQDHMETILLQLAGRPIRLEIVTRKGSSGLGSAPSQQTSPEPLTETPCPVSQPDDDHAAEDKHVVETASAEVIQDRTVSDSSTPFTFDSFVVGGCNKLAFSASRTVADNPGCIYNPLFIYGKTGLGKTHLLKAIGNTISDRNPSARVIFKTSMDYLHEYVHCVQSGRWEDYRNRYYHHCDVLLIDDVQFWARKKETQHEFFHVFNFLEGRKKQIVLTCDQPPEELQNVEDRLLSRFSLGLIVNVAIPDLDTRVAIIKAKSEAANVRIRDEVALYIAESFPNHIRELEGCVNMLGLWEQHIGKTITLDQAKQQFGNRVQPPAAPISMDKVAEVIATHYQVSVQDMRSKRRHQTVALPRQVFWYVCRNLLNLEISRIARWSQKDRSTILSGIRKIERLMEEDRFIQNHIANLRNKLSSNT